MRVYVVMGNDYPAAVFKTAQGAEAYCQLRTSEPIDRKIYWRVYDFELKE